MSDTAETTGLTIDQLALLRVAALRKTSPTGAGLDFCLRATLMVWIIDELTNARLRCDEYDIQSRTMALRQGYLTAIQDYGIEKDPAALMLLAVERYL